MMLLMTKFYGVIKLSVVLIYLFQLQIVMKTKNVKMV